MAQLVKNSSTMQETWVRFLGWEDPRVGKIPWRKERLPTPVFWPGEFHGLYSPWGCKVRRLVTFTFNFFFNSLFISGCAGSSLLHRLSLVVASKGYSSWQRSGSHCPGFSCCGTWALGAWAWLLHGMWYPLGPGIEPVSPVLAGRFLTSAPPGKSELKVFSVVSSRRYGCGTVSS